MMVRHYHIKKRRRMPVKQNKDKGALAGWSAAGFATGFVIGYVAFDSVISGVLLGFGLGFAMGAGFTKSKKPTKR